ncbi:hypothetical protein GJ744_003725 [Endocarpon pusillum]|uniref:Uncharacterized protein n=1 Tax=Endocarpon pusillum TaxID=364733 RepID=A0A8H7AAB0_9EURO|nr:hypothetical protein GJ744_003725 [Endocarpon pusillum]
MMVTSKSLTQKNHQSYPPVTSQYQYGEEFIQNQVLRQGAQTPQAAEIREDPHTKVHNEMSILRVCARRLSEPEFTQYELENGEVVNLVTVEGMKKAGLLDTNFNNKAKNPFLANLETLVGTSPKIDTIKAILNQKGYDYRNDPSKVIVLCYSPTTALILYYRHGRQYQGFAEADGRRFDGSGPSPLSSSVGPTWATPRQ